MAYQILLQDNFTDPDGTAIISHVPDIGPYNIYSGSNGVEFIYSNQARNAASASYGVGSPINDFGNDCYIQMRVGASTTTTYNFTIGLRNTSGAVTNPTQARMWATFTRNSTSYPNGAILVYQKLVSQVSNNIYFNNAYLLNPNDLVKFSITGPSSAATVDVSVNGSSVWSTVIAVPPSGYEYFAFGAAGTGNQNYVDNLEYGVNMSFDWTMTTLSPRITNYWDSMTFLNNKFFAIAEAENFLFSSSDGQNWSKVNVPQGTNPFTSHSNIQILQFPLISYGNGKYTIVASDSDLYLFTITSTDGVTWNGPYYNIPASIYQGEQMNLQFNNGYFYLTNITFTSDKYARSSDGQNWTELTFPLNGTQDNIFYGNNLYVTTMKVGTSYYLMSSSDGQNWTSTLMTDINGFSMLGFFNGHFLMKSPNADSTTNIPILTSTDGVNTTRYYLGISGNIDYLTMQGSRLFLTNNPSSLKLIYTDDMINWITVTMPAGAPYANPSTIVGTPNALLFMGSSGSCSITTDSGTTWQTLTFPNQVFTWYFVAYGNNMFASVGSSTGNFAYYPYSSGPVLTDSHKRYWKNGSWNIVYKEYDNRRF